MTTKKMPKVLAISGSDVLSGGGFQADLATYSQYGIYGLRLVLIFFQRIQTFLNGN